MTPSGQGNPNKIHVSHSYEGACQAQDPAQTLSDFGEITIGESYHLIIDTNYTFTTVSISSNDKSKSGVYHFPRSSPTDPDHVGTEANVYFMSGKFGSGFYNRGNGTLSNIVLTSRVFTPQPTREPTTLPTLSPSDAPTTPTVSPTPLPTTSPSKAPTPRDLIIPTENRSPPPTPADGSLSSTTSLPTTSEESSSGDPASVFIDGTTIAIIISVLTVCCCLCCGVLIAYKRTIANTSKKYPITDYMGTEELARPQSQPNGARATGLANRGGPFPNSNPHVHPVGVPSNSHHQFTGMNGMSAMNGMNVNGGVYPQGASHIEMQMYMQQQMQQSMPHSSQHHQQQQQKVGTPYTPEGTLKNGDMKFPSVSPANRGYNGYSNPQHQIQFMSQAQKEEWERDGKRAYRPTPMGPSTEDWSSDLERDEEDYRDEQHHELAAHHQHGDYLSAAQREELRVTPQGQGPRGLRGYSDSVQSSSHQSGHHQMNVFQAPHLDAPPMPLVKMDSDEEIMNGIHTSGFIGGGDSGDYGSESTVNNQGQIHQDLQQGMAGNQYLQQGLPPPADRQHFQGGTHSSIPNLPPSTRPSQKNTMASEHKDELSQDIVHYVETEDGGGDLDLEYGDEAGDYVSPSDHGGNGPDEDIYNVAAKITIGHEHDNYDSQDDNDGNDDDDIYGDPEQGQEEYEDEYFEDEETMQ